MNKLILYSALVAGTVGMLALGANTAFAGTTSYGPNHTEEREAAIDTALKNQDVNAWKEIMTENGRSPRVVEVVDTKEELAKFAQMREYKQAGEDEKAQEIRTELGLGSGYGYGKGNGTGNGRAMRNGDCVR